MKYTLVVLIGFISFQSFTQNYFDILNVTYTNTTANDFEIIDTQTTVKELALELDFPIIINDKTILLTGIFANKTKLKLSSDMPYTNLNVLGLKVGVNKTLSDSWSSTFIVYSKFASDITKLSHEHLQVAILSIFTNKKEDNFKYKYGVYANTEKYGLIVVPIFGLFYLSDNKKFEANLNLPINGDVNYKINKKTWLGMRFDGLGTTYNLVDQNYGTKGAYVSKTSNELVSYFRYKLSKSIYINTKVGYAISRNYKVFDSEDKIDLALSSFYFGDNRTQLNERFKDGAIFKLELLYRLHFD
ncbi:hypothetical protein GCM10023314_29440 [Algibacter agarivorans]|uniref:DUF6268 domain-containing protein n=1 Tax=Algibacter agarivorans TaxID=1109741 RepID=A0ABP9GVH5_9FLAO